MELILKYFPELQPQQLRQFEKLQTLYTSWNEKINVISRKDIDGLYEKHILHSLAIATQFKFAPGSNIIDIGTGGGFPGIPLAIFFPDSHFHLVDSIAKKLKVVDAVAADAGLTNVSTQHARAEELSRPTAQKPLHFDFAVSRAVASLKELWTWSKPLLKTGGQQRVTTDPSSGLICLKGGDLNAEISESGTRPRLTELSSIFSEPFFKEKFLLYVAR